VNELPAPVPPNEHAGPATLLIHLPVLVLACGGGTTGDEGGIAVDLDLAVNMSTSADEEHCEHQKSTTNTAKHAQEM